MKQTKVSVALFSFFDRSGIERYLEKQARKGWILDRHSGVWWQFHRIEPKKLHVSVVFFPKASGLDSDPTDAQLNFVELCEHSGWRLATSDVRTLFFYHAAEEPTPIETDAALELSTIHAAAKKGFLPYAFLFLGLSLWFLFCSLDQLSYNPIGLLSGVGLYTTMESLLILVYELTNLSAYFRWYHHAKAAAALDERFTETGSNRIRYPLLLLLAPCLILGFSKIVGGFGWPWILPFYGGLLLSPVMMAFLLAQWIKRKEKWSLRRKRIAVGFGILGSIYLAVVIPVFSGIFGDFPSGLRELTTERYEYKGDWYEIRHDSLPLCIEDLTGSNGEGDSREITRESTVLMAFEQGGQYPRRDRSEQPELAYSITTVKLPLLYDWCKEIHLKDISNLDGHPRSDSERWVEHEGAYRAVEPAPWLAQEAYQLWINGEEQMRFLLCYDDHFVNISFRPAAAWHLTPEQMQRVGEKLGSKNSKEN